MADKTSSRIKEAIEKSGLTLMELQAKTGISKSAIQRYASGETDKIPVDAVKSLAKATGVSAMYLMEWDIPSSESNSQWGNDTANQEYLSNNPELLALYNEIKNRQDIYILFDKTKDLEPKDVESVLMFVQTIRKQRGLDE